MLLQQTFKNREKYIQSVQSAANKLQRMRQLNHIRRRPLTVSTAHAKKLPHTTQSIRTQLNRVQAQLSTERNSFTKRINFTRLKLLLSPTKHR